MNSSKGKAERDRLGRREPKNRLAVVCAYAETAICGINPPHADQLPNNEATENDLLTIAQRSIQANRSAIAKSIDATPLDDHQTLERLGPILAKLRAAESILNAIEAPYNA